MSEIIKCETVIHIPDGRLPIAELVKQLEMWNCPTVIIEQLQEWMLNLYLDRVKLSEWEKNCGEVKQ